MRLQDRGAWSSTPGDRRAGAESSPGAAGGSPQLDGPQRSPLGESRGGNGDRNLDSARFRDAGSRPCGAREKETERPAAFRTARPLAFDSSNVDATGRSPSRTRAGGDSNDR